ncbi:MAG: RNA-binding protein [Planctomycetes bacterium]|nr:RNA-binding protein [Planctomycetota bacterium]MBI3846073.1 RNA-binding protein [Planctomycetota bacterium]
MPVSVYIGNLPYKTNEAEIRSLFEPFGSLERVNIVTDPTGNPRGFAFVDFTKKEDADRAIAELNGSSMGGRQLNVSEARPRQSGAAASERPAMGGGERHFGGGSNRRA